MPVRPHPPGLHRPVHVHQTRVIRRPARVVTYRQVRPYHGVFVYGPVPGTHVYYHDSGGEPVEVAQRDLPERAVDRNQTLAVGVRGGALWSGYVDGSGYGDAGLGLAARYRPVETFGLELSVEHHDQTWTAASERSQTVGSGSVELFAWPWTRVSPYAILGMTYTSRSIADEVWQGDGLSLVETRSPLIGPHAGLGLELALGRSAALDFEARYIGYVNRQAEDPAVPGALTTTAGLMFHF